MVHDQNGGHFARQGTDYSNLLGKPTNSDSAIPHSSLTNNFDNLNFGHYPYPLETILESESAIYTNLPYSISESAPAALRKRLPTPYFACRRKNGALSAI